MVNVARWIKSPIDILAPYSYRFTLLRVPMDSLVEVMTARAAVPSRNCDMYVDPSDGPRVTKMKAALSRWPALLRLGYVEFCDNSRRNNEGGTYIVAETTSREWNLLINFESGFSGFNNEYFHHHFSCGSNCAPVSDFGCIDVVRFPDVEGLTIGRGRCKFGQKGITGIQVMGRGLVPDGDYYSEIGIFIGGGGGHRQILEWPIEDCKYRYPGIGKMIDKKGRVYNRFTDRDMSELLRYVYGLDVFSPEFYTENISLIDSGYYRASYDPDYVYRYRDEFMPNWKEEGDYLGLCDNPV